MGKRKKRFNIKTSPFINIGGNLRVHKEAIQALEGDLEIVKKKYYQVSDYTKVITSKEGIDLNTYRKLSGFAKDLLYYIWHILEYNSPTFELKISTVTSLFNVKESYAYRGIRELINVEYIARTDIKEVYWINHNKFFKGNYTFDLYARPKDENKLKTDKK